MSAASPATPPVWTTTGPATTTTLSFCSRALRTSAAVWRTAVSTWRSEEMPLDMKANESRSRSLDSGRDADAAHADHDAVALAQVAQAAAEGASFVDHDHGVHALVFGLDPLLADAHVGAMVGGGVEILRGAAVALHGAQFGVAGIHGGAPSSSRLSSSRSRSRPSGVSTSMRR